MRRNQVLVGIILAAFSVAGLAQKKTTPAPVSPIVLVDANGKTVGRVAEFPIVLIPVNGSLFAFKIGINSVGSTNAMNFASGYVHFTQQSCTGDPYIPLALSWAPVATVLVYVGQLEVYLPAGADRSAIVNSYRRVTSEGNIECTNLAGPTSTYGLPATYVNMTGMFVAPFRIE